MRKLICLLVLVMIASGCATSKRARIEDAISESVESGEIARDVKAPWLAAKNKSNLAKLSIGITRQEVLEIMRLESADIPSWLRSLNPYRSETLALKDKTFELLYYYTSAESMDGTATKDELTPIVFEHDKLISYGWSSLDKMILENTKSK